MSGKCWKLLVAIFVVVSSLAVMLVGMLAGADAGFVGLISLYAGMIGIVVGIIMGIGTIINSRNIRED